MVERKLWGKLVNDTRQLAIKLAVYIPVEREEDRMFFRRMIPNVAFAMKEHLRDSILIGEMDTVNDTYQNEIIKSKHRPNCLNKIPLFQDCKTQQRRHHQQRTTNYSRSRN